MRTTVDVAHTCDSSGLCEEVDTVDHSPRVVTTGSVAALLADEAPLVRGHCLVLTRRHVPRSSLLSTSEYVQLGEFVHQSRRIVEDVTREATITVEHGAADGRSVWDCVRHAHVHVVPADLRLTGPSIDEIASAFMNVVAKLPSDEPHRTRTELLALPEYLTLAVNQEIWVGTPKPDIRHGSRALIVRLCGLNETLIDWGIWARGRAFHESLATLKPGMAAIDG